MGEATKNLSEEFRKSHKKIEWKKIAGTRDKLIHQYFGIDLVAVWRVIKEKIPELKKQISKIKKDLEM